MLFALAPPKLYTSPAPGHLDNPRDEACDIQRVDIVAHLLAFETKNPVLAAFEIAFYEVGEEPMPFHAGMMRARYTAGAEAACWHAEVAPVLLNQDIRRELGGSKQRMLRSVDGECFRNALRVPLIKIIPARLELFEPKAIRVSP
jgi:hypothetical protein